MEWQWVHASTHPDKNVCAESNLHQVVSYEELSDVKWLSVGHEDGSSHFDKKHVCGTDDHGGQWAGKVKFLLADPPPPQLVTSFIPAHERPIVNSSITLAPKKFPSPDYSIHASCLNEKKQFKRVKISCEVCNYACSYKHNRLKSDTAYMVSGVTLL